MNTARRSPARTLAVVVSVLATAAAAVGAMPGAAEAAGPGVCRGVQKCRVVVRTDVNGDGVRDAVGIARRGRSDGPKGAVIIRVKTGPHQIATARRKLGYWYTPPWQGAASLDGRRGAELMVGHTAGAHTEFFRALTWRNGGLAALPAPGGASDWVVDGAYNVSYGWLHRAGDPVGTIRRLTATRNGSSSTFTGTVTTHRWTPGGWRQVQSRTNTRLPERIAVTWGGFRVPGLQRW